MTAPLVFTVLLGRRIGIIAEQQREYLVNADNRDMQYLEMIILAIN